MNEKTKSIVSWCTLIGALIIIIGYAKDSTKRVLTCAYQCITINIISIGGQIIFFILGMFLPFMGLLTSLLGLACFGFMVWGLILACTDAEKVELPGVGDLAKKMFGKFIEKGTDGEPVAADATMGNQNMQNPAQPAQPQQPVQQQQPNVYQAPQQPVQQPMQQPMYPNDNVNPPSAPNGFPENNQVTYQAPTTNETPFTAAPNPAQPMQTPPTTEPGFTNVDNPNSNNV